MAWSQLVDWLCASWLVGALIAVAEPSGYV